MRKKSDMREMWGKKGERKGGLRKRQGKGKGSRTGKDGGVKR